MFDQLFVRPCAIARHCAGPLAQERLRYLSHLASQGMTRETLRQAADHILMVSEQLGLADRPMEAIRKEEIQRTATAWAKRHPRARHRKGGPTSTSRFRRYATRWLRFLGRLEQQPSPFAEQIAAFADYMRRDRGLSPRTISTRCRFVRHFLERFGTPACLQEITLTRVDEVLLEMIASGRYVRVTIGTCASTLRAFFRFAERQGWCRNGLADAIKGPRIFAQESLPRGPSWGQVRQLLAASKGDRPRDIRNHAILMLLATYGLRAGEVTRFRLEDFDWDHERFVALDSKTHQMRSYPVSRAVGDAVLHYLKEVRPRSTHRNVFLSLCAPVRPLSDLWPIVARHLRPLAVSLPHHGPHAFRHACAAQLLAQGHSLKEIGDYLGHRDPDTTRIYAKVDLAGLRQVADFDLGGLL